MGPAAKAPRSQTAGVHRRDLRQRQDDKGLWPLAARRTPGRRRSVRDMKDSDIHSRSALRWAGGPLRPRRADGADAFFACLDEALAPTFNPGDVVVSGKRYISGSSGHFRTRSAIVDARGWRPSRRHRCHRDGTRTRRPFPTPASSPIMPGGTRSRFMHSSPMDRAADMAAGASCASMQTTFKPAAQSVWTNWALKIRSRYRPVPRPNPRLDGLC